MPDMRSELQKLADLKFDDDGDTMIEPTAIGLGVSETFFNLIRDNPGSTRAQLVSLASKSSIKNASSSSLVVQFVKRGLIKAIKNGSVSTYTAVGKSYTRGYLRREKPVAKATPKPTPAPDNSVRVVGDVPQLLDALSIVQARELYDALKKIFGA
jgi:hypothetical protein